MPSRRNAGNMRVLVVDDDPVVLASCRRILAAEGYEVTCSSSVGDALEVLGRQEFDLLLVDVIMPELDGIQLIGRVRRSQAQTPILAMSGYPTPETVSSGMSVGATHFIAKPFTPQELTAAVNKAVHRDTDAHRD